MATTLKFVTQYGIENVGSVSISSGTAATPGISLSSDENSGIFSPGDNILAFSTDGTERLRFSAVGAWGIAGANYGTSGQLLTSNGDSAAPSWQTVIPAQTGNSGKYLTTDGSSASWSVIASVATLADATVLGTTANTAVSLKGKTSTTGASAAMTVAAGDSSAAGNSLTVSGGVASGMNTGGSIVIKSGDAGASGAAAGSVSIHADSSYGGGAVTVRGGDSGGNGTLGAIAAGGSLTLRGGDSTNGATGSTPGAVTIRGGNSAATTAGGSVTLSGGTGPAGGGALIFQTAATTSLTEKFRILANGAWSVGTDGASYGTSGQVLTSNGNAAPSWQAAPSGLPAQTGNSGKYLTTDGTSASWGNISLTGTVALESSSVSGYALQSYSASSGSTISTINSGILLQNSTVLNNTGAAAQTLVGVVSAPKISHDATAGVNTSSAQGFIASPSIISSAATSQVSILGANIMAQRSYAADASSSINNSLTGVSITTGHTSTLASTANTNNITGVSVTGTLSAGTANNSYTGLRTSMGANPTSGSVTIGTMASAYLNTASIGTGAGTVSAVNYYGLVHLGLTNGANGTITNAYELFLGGINNSGTITNKYSIYQASTTLANYFGSATTFASSVAFGARYDELRSDVTASSTTTFDCSLSNVFNVTLSASITTLSFSNIPANGRVFTITMFLNQDATGSRTVTWPAAVKWSGGTAPTLTTTASKTDIITLVTHDGGTNWYGFVAGQNF